MQDPRRVRLYCWALILGSAVFRFWFSGLLPIAGDEAYHWNWTRHLAACYHDHGGVLAAGGWLAHQLIDPHSERGARFASLVFITLTLIVAAGFARRVAKERDASELEQERAGLLAAFTIAVTPVYFVLQQYNVTDAPAILFAMLSLDQLHRALTTGRTINWALCGVVTAAAVQSKYLTLGLGPVGLLMLWFERRSPYFPRPSQLFVAGATFVLGMFPMVYWNATNDWGTIRFNFLDRHDSMGFRAKYFVEFIGSQLAVLNPVMAVCATTVLVRKAMRIKELSTGQRTLLLGACVPLTLFLIGSFTRRIGLHWTSSAWTPALVLVAIEVACPSSWLATKGRALWKWAIGFSIGLFIVIHLLVMAPQILMSFSIGEWGRDGQVKTSKIGEIWGWPELADRLVLMRDEMEAAQDDGAGVFVSTNQFGTSSMVSFYSGSRIDTKLWSVVKDHGESLRIWQDLPSHKGQDMIFATKRDPERFTKVLEERFAKVDQPLQMLVWIDREPMVVPVGTEPDPDLPPPIRTFFIFRCYDYDGVEPYPLKREKK